MSSKKSIAQSCEDIKRLWEQLPAIEERYRLLPPPSISPSERGRYVALMADLLGLEMKRRRHERALREG